MSSPEVERFEVTEDDLQNEFNPYRKQFRQTKHQATYGKPASYRLYYGNAGRFVDKTFRIRRFVDKLERFVDRCINRSDTWL